MTTGTRHIGSIAGAAISVILVGACSSLGSESGTTTVGSPPYEHGSGTVASESRGVAAFHAISAAQGVEVVLATGTPAVTVTADDNLVPHVTTTVADGVLAIDISGAIQTRHPLKVTVTTAASVDGLSASTGSTIDAVALEGPALAVTASTGATVRGGGHVVAISVTAVGGATADLRNVEATRANVDVSTGSTAQVNASDAVTGRCSSGSTLRVRGDAATSGVAVDGTSSLVRE